MPNELTNPNNVVTEERLAQFYQQILPYLGGMPDVLANKFNRADLYSTDEKLIGRWIDGKPMYQKVIPCSITEGSRHWNTVATIPDVDTPVYAYVKAADYIMGGYWGSSANDYSGITFEKSSGSGIVKVVVNGLGNWSGFVIAKYTKTTDSAVEIGSDTDYSTTEKIVGTWIDGKPVYQKTVTQSINATETWNTILSLGTTCNIIDIHGLFIRSDNGYAVPIGTSVALSGRFNLCGNYPNIGDFSVSNEAAGTIIVTIQYTKTS